MAKKAPAKAAARKATKTARGKDLPAKNAKNVKGGLVRLRKKTY
jgi:hypothetical protein